MSRLQDEVVLHVWPSKWSLPSFDPICLATVMFLQLNIPGKFKVVECNNPDMSPSGQLPFLTIEQYTVSGFTSIVKYVADAKLVESPCINEALPDRMEKSKTVAWNAHVQTHLGNILYHALYSHHDNWLQLTQPALASMFPVPQRYYVPERIRESYRPRLERVGLWDAQAVEKGSRELKVDLRRENNHKFHQAFEREKASEKAKSLFDIYTRLLEEKDFASGDRPTSLDILLAAHLLMLLNPVYPDSTLQTLLQTSYPTLASHARRVYAHIFHPLSSPLEVAASSSMQWKSLISWPPATWKARTVPKTDKEIEEEARDARMRWGFFGVTLGSLAVYLTFVFKHVVEVQQTMDNDPGLKDEQVVDIHH